MGGAYSQSNYNLTIEDVNSLRDILIGKHFSGKIDGSLMGNKSLGWKPYSMKQSILSLNQHATPEKILFAQEQLEAALKGQTRMSMAEERQHQSSK